MNFSKKPAFDFDVSAYPPLPAMKGVFITGTDTGVGKTLIAGAVARQLRHGGKKVEVFKPVATGCRRCREGLVSEDSEFLAACADSGRPLAEITPLRYAPALSPNVAAARSSQPVDLDAIFAAYRRMEGTADVVVVEGVGGLLCPISDDFWIIHFAKMTNLPLVIVAKPGLGTINHTLLTIHAARSAGLMVAGVVINRYHVEPETAPAGRSDRVAGIMPARVADVSSAKTNEHGKTCENTMPASQSDFDSEVAMLNNPQQIAQRGRVEILAIVPDEASNSVTKATIGPDTQYVISQAHWEKICGI